MQETVPAVYPPIARVAHIMGTVVMMVKFEENGTVSSIRNLSGSSLLQGASDDFVRGWRANLYTGPRECPIAITFLLFGPSDKECTSDYKPTPGNAIRVDLQHVNIVHENVCVTVERDPIGKRVHRFHL